jgi:predicted peroxiredoxin
MDSITVFAVGGRQARILGGTPQEKDEKEIIRHLAAKHRLTLIETERLSELLKEPTTDEVERWLAKRGLQAVKKPSGEENGVEKNEAVQASPLLPLEEISRQAKEHGWRLVVCRRKVMPKQTTLRKKAR